MQRGLIFKFLVSVKKQKPLFFVGMVFLFIVFVFSGSYLVNGHIEEQFTSVEIGIATESLLGEAGGYAIPASCPSYAHFPGQCGPVSGHYGACTGTNTLISGTYDVYALGCLDNTSPGGVSGYGTDPAYPGATVVIVNTDTGLSAGDNEPSFFCSGGYNISIPGGAPYRVDVHRRNDNAVLASLNLGQAPACGQPRLITTNNGTGMGSVSRINLPQDYNCTLGPGEPCSRPYVPGTFVKLEATASPGNTFLFWQSGCDAIAPPLVNGNGSVCEVTTGSADKDLSVVFLSGAPLPPPAQCSNGIDDDGDDNIDAADSGCHTDNNPNNPASYDPNDDLEFILPGTVTIGATPSQVFSGETSTIVWSSSNTVSCSVTGTNGDSWSGLSGSQTTSPITETTIYTIVCTDFNGDQTGGVTTVSLRPQFEEF